VLAQSVSDHTVPDHTVPDHTASDHTVPDHTVPDHTAPDHTVPDHTYALHWIGVGKLLCDYTINRTAIQTEHLASQLNVMNHSKFSHDRQLVHTLLEQTNN
jgi:hypothetical protein